MQEFVIKLSKALEKEEECWQSGFIQPTMLSQDAITGTKRDDVVAWMIEKSDKFGFHPETWALAVTILDRFLRVVKAQAKYLQCIAITCLFIAAKFSEEEESLLTAAELVSKSCCSCTASDVVRMERIVVEKLQWNLRATTPMEFIYIFHALLTYGDARTNTAREQLATLIIRLRQCAACHALLGFRPSTLALSILSLELEHAGTSWLPITMGLQRLASIDNVSLINCREKISYLLAAPNHADGIVPLQLSRPMKRKMRSESENSIPGDEEMYEGVKRLYGPDDDFMLPSGCGAEVQMGIATRELAATVAI